MHIRPYLPSDRDAVFALLRLNTPAYFAPSEEAGLVYYLANEAEHYFVAESEGNILACGGFNLADNDTTGKISWDIVHPEQQGKGVGSLLTQFRIEKLQEIETVERIVVRTSQLAYRFYARFGFEVREVVKDYWAEGFDLYFMEMVSRRFRR